MIAILGRPRTSAKIDDISVLGQVAWLLGQSNLIIDEFSFPYFMLWDELESSVSCRLPNSSIGLLVHLLALKPKICSLKCSVSDRDPDRRSFFTSDSDSPPRYQ